VNSTAWYTQFQQYLDSNELDQAQVILDSARKLKPNHIQTWTAIARLHFKRADWERAIHAFELLNREGTASPYDLNQLGISYQKTGLYSQAIEAYKASLGENPDWAVLYNLGLIHADDEISQDADAADYFRLALELNPDYKAALSQFESTKQKLSPLANQVRQTGTIILPKSSWYSHFLNPFDLFEIRLETWNQGRPDFSLLKKARKKAIAESVLNDGKISWLKSEPDVDSSRIHNLYEQLLDQEKASFFALIHQYEQLNNFLSFGDVSLFLFDEKFGAAYALGRERHEGPSFTQFVSGYFATVYDRVLATALESKRLALVEVLFDGRRIMIPEDEHKAFASGYKWTKGVIKSVDDMLSANAASPISDQKLLNVFEKTQAIEISNLLPYHFRDYQSELVSKIREIAVDNYNSHGDSTTAKAVLRVAPKFKFKSKILNEKLATDLKSIEGIIADEKKHSARVSSRTFSDFMRPNTRFVINEEGIKHGDRFISTEDMSGIKVGSFVTYRNGVEASRDYTFIVQSTEGAFINLSFSKAGIIGGISRMVSLDEVVPIVNRNRGEQESAYQKLLDTIDIFIAPAIISNVIESIQKGEDQFIGAVKMTSSGVSFSIGFFGKKVHLIPWSRVATGIRHGDLNIVDRNNKKVAIHQPVRHTFNALLFSFIVKYMTEA
jgi:tetratricopeptide (TPR) repeat protein